MKTIDIIIEIRNKPNAIHIAICAILMEAIDLIVSSYELTFGSVDFQKSLNIRNRNNITPICSTITCK